MQNNYSSTGGTLDSVQANIDSVEYLVRSMAKAYARNANLATLDADDLFQEVMIALMNVVEEYDPSKCPFEKYVGVHARYAMMKCIKSERRRNRIDLERSTYSDKTEYSPEQRLAVLTALNSGKINPKNREVIVDKYMLNRSGRTPSFKDLGSKFGCTGMNIKYRESSAIDTLRKLCSNVA